VAHARLFSLLGEYVVGSGLTESELEARFLELCVRSRLAMPATQVPFGRHRADFVWHPERLIVETDGRAFHDTDIAYLDDRVKDRTLKAAGYEVLRFTWAEVERRPAAIARELRAALARRRRELGGGGAKSGPLPR
jgi:very-short-patch-repair endonuclease